MHHIRDDDLAAMDARYRNMMINSLSGFKSANLIGTSNGNGEFNLAIFSSVVHLGSSPALVGFITRPNSVSRHTLENIRLTGHFTINQVSEDFWQAAHQTSARYSAEQCEFEQTGLTPQIIDGITAPFVQESRLKYALTLEQIIPIDINNTLMIIGRISHILCDEQAIKNDGYIDIQCLDTVMVSGLDSYHTGSRLSRLSYAKPNMALRKLSLDGQPETNLT